MYYLCIDKETNETKKYKSINAMAFSLNIEVHVVKRILQFYRMGDDDIPMVRHTELIDKYYMKKCADTWELLMFEIMDRFHMRITNYYAHMKAFDYEWLFVESVILKEGRYSKKDFNKMYKERGINRCI